jgi:putative ABC transport system substrate-binding protein
MKKSTLRVLSAAAVAAMMLSLTACGNSSSSSSSGSASSAEDEGGSAQSYTIGICQLVQHDALDAATQGFKDALEETLGEENVTFDEQNANGDSPTCTTIINGFVSSNVDLILANATSPLQAAAAGTDSIPVIGTSVTDYATALDIDDWSGTTGRNISGTSDLAPLDEQAAMIQELFPDAQTIGLLYCSAEANSLYQINVIEGYLTDMGYTCERFSFTDSNDVAQVTQSACASSDVIYIPTDNTAASNTELIANIVLPAKVPVVAGEEGICNGCGVATLSISYYDIGYQAGLMAYDILANGADVSTMEVQYAPNVTKEYNASVCEQLGLTMPDDYVAIEG